MKENGQLRQVVTEFDQLNEVELRRYKKERRDFLIEVLKDWPRTLIDVIVPYKKC
jgi:hypothetical protein